MSFRRLAILASLACSLDFFPGVFGANVQNPFLRLPSDAPTHRQAVVDIFLESYSAYKEFAFGHDDLTPVSKSFTDGRNGWGASIVDALSTLQIMGQHELFNEAVNFSTKIDFSVSHTTDTVSIFETTIRYLGGLLSAFELDGQRNPALVEKAKEVANKMTAAFEVPGASPVPFGHLDFNTSNPQFGTSNIAEAGTLTLEWFTLAKHTGNDTYRQLAENSVRHIANLPAPLPAMPAQGIDPLSGQPVGAFVSWGGGSDSYFEYLIKYPRLTNTNDNIFADHWATAVDSSIKHLLRNSTVGNHIYLADQEDDGTISHVGSHLACFHAGNWLFGGRLMNNQTVVDIGLKLNDACWNTYASTFTGIGPEAFGFFSSDGNFTGSSPSADDIAFYNEHGFFILPGSSDYFLRPEVLESNFYAWRVTGDRKFLDRAAAAIDSFNKFLKAPAGFAGIGNVNEANSGFIDDMESFWFAEVLKYLFLTFDDPDHINLDEWVFNTEAHPFRAPRAKPTYGSRKLIPAASFAPFRSTSGKLPLVSPSSKLPNNIPDL
ncbi:glycoside hydrolase family 47 protein [Panus rudis PR-1116 ss-1]|nr:glycoside hydrolase family 47 protein [Panus rudis PR-1116 ss-1]